MSVVLTLRCRPRVSTGLDTLIARLGWGKTDEYLEDAAPKTF